MDGAAAAGAGGGGGGGGGPAPFLLKTYDMVDDSSTDDIVSWSPTRASFVVWNPPEFARVLLPTYFKHNNFSSFIRQLNTYGFRKIDPERWEFANEEFVKDKKHLLKNIHRRKPIHSHSNPPGSAVDPERAAFEEEIDKLSREKSSLENDISRFKQQQPATKLQLEDLTHRVDSMEERQDNLINFLKKAIQNPIFVENLARKLESMDFSAYNKKRRLPEVDQSNIVQEDSFIDGHSTSRPEFGNAIQQDFSNKLTLELSPAVSDINLVSRSTQSSSEGAGSPERRISESFTRNTQMRPSGVQFTTEPLELTDTGTSFTFINDSSFPVKQGSIATAIVSSPQQSSNPNEELEGYTSCQLNLTLASSPLQVNKTQSSGGIPQLVDEIVKPPEWNRNEASLNVSEKNATTSDVNVALSSSRETPPPTSNLTPAAPQARVNDVFWEQFLTERPGSSDVEEASSNYRANPSSDMQEDRRSGHGMSRNTRILEHLTL